MKYIKGLFAGVVFVSAYLVSLLGDTRFIGACLLVMVIQLGSINDKLGELKWSAERAVGFLYQISTK